MTVGTVNADALTSDGLLVDGLTVRFGGLIAVDDVCLHVPEGRAIGLIGPNGAGKTTTFNACSGLVRPARGRITLFGVDVTHKNPPTRARLGLGRTFQRMELFDRLSVRQNVAMGLEAKLAGTRLTGWLVATRAENARVQESTAAALDRCGIAALADRRAGVLTSGQRRLVELARALAADFRILLLDEPSSGLDATETTTFGDVLREVVSQDRRGLLLVEHDMSLVRAVCDYAYVLDFGRLIDHGSMRHILTSDAVRTAYLGEEDVA